MRIQDLKTDIKQIRNIQKLKELRQRIKKQVQTLSRSISKSDKMPCHQEHVALDRALATLSSTDISKIQENVEHIYKDIYLTNLSKVRYLTFNLNKESKKLGVKPTNPNIINIAHNVLIRRFGLGVHYEILSVQSRIISIDNTPIVTIIIKYL